MLRGSLAIAIISSLFLGASVIAAETKRMAIIPATIGEPRETASTSEVYDRVAEGFELRRGVEVVSYTELFIDGVEPVATKVRDCGADVGCTSAALHEAKIPLCLRVIVNSAIDPPLVTFDLIDAETASVTATAIREVEEGKELPTLLTEEVAALLDQVGVIQWGRIAVSVTPTNAALRIGQHAPESSEPGLFIVPPGRYDVEAQSDGYAQSKMEVVVTSGETSRVALILDEKESPFVGSTLFWGIIGVAAVGAATAIVLATDPFGDERPGCLCITGSGQACGVCP